MIFQCWLNPILKLLLISEIILNDFNYKDIIIGDYLNYLSEFNFLLNYILGIDAKNKQRGGPWCRIFFLILHRLRLSSVKILRSPLYPIRDTAYFLLIYNTANYTEPSMGELDSHLTGFFYYLLENAMLNLNIKGKYNFV